MTPRTVDPVALLPHGPGFRFVTAVREHIPGRSATGSMRVGADDAFVRDHFPGRPIVPGVLVTEALAQLAGIAAHRPADGNGDGNSDGNGDGNAAVAGTPALLAHIDVRFGTVAVPPCDIELVATVLRRLGALVVCEVSARLDEKEVARGEIVLRLDSEGSADA